VEEHHSGPPTGATEIAKRTIPFMSRKGIPLTPDNYRIWFEYFHGTMVELVQAIDNLLNRGEVFNEKTHEDLTRRFLRRDLREESERKIADEMRAVDEASGASRKIIEPMVKSLEGWSGASASYGQKLHAMVTRFAEPQDARSLADIVRGLADETTRISQQNRKISDEMGRSSRQLDELRHNLETARAEARTDDLTRLLNRRAFNEALAEEVRRAGEEGNPSALAIADIDHFKRINDTYGHMVGDKALKAISGQLRGGVSVRDSVFRYGGEEFAVILRDTSPAKAAGVMNALRLEVAEHEFVVRDQVERITISAGLAMVGAGMTAESIQRAADEALYLAKNSGRNQVKTGEDVAAAHAARA